MRITRYEKLRAQTKKQTKKWIVTSKTDWKWVVFRDKFRLFTQIQACVVIFHMLVGIFLRVGFFVYRIELPNS